MDRYQITVKEMINEIGKELPLILGEDVEKFMSSLVEMLMNS